MNEWWGCQPACLPVHIPGLTWILTPLDSLVGCLDSQAMGVINDPFQSQEKSSKDPWQGHTLGPGPSSPLTSRQKTPFESFAQIVAGLHWNRPFSVVERKGLPSPRHSPRLPSLCLEPDSSYICVT